MRLLLAGYAQLLLERLRTIGLAGTALAQATAGTIRVQLLKIAARVTVSVRQVHVRLASAFAWREVFARAHVQLGAWVDPGQARVGLGAPRGSRSDAATGGAARHRARPAPKSFRALPRRRRARRFRAFGTENLHNEKIVLDAGETPAVDPEGVLRVFAA